MIEFNSIEELKKRTTPALIAKLNELKSKNYNLISIDDIWNFLIKNKWQKAIDLTLYDIINDIMNVNEEELEEYGIRRSEQNDKS